jgi:uncharacterized Zn-finger protein
MQNKERDTIIEGKNENFSIGINVLPPKSWVYCEGYAKFGHPRIFLDLSKTGAATCPYCSRQYMIKK